MHLNGFTTETKLPLNHAVPAGNWRESQMS